MTIAVGFAEVAVAASTPVISMTNRWTYNQSGNDLGTSWREYDFNDAAWSQGRGLLYCTSNALPAPKNTALSLTNAAGTHLITYYFRTHFLANLSGPFDNALIISNILDDGAVYYLNGQEILRVGMSRGPLNHAEYDTLYSNRSVGTATVQGPYCVVVSNLHMGDNVLAVEVHQDNATSPDVVFGASVETTRGPSAQLSPYSQAVYSGSDAYIGAISSFISTCQWYYSRYEPSLEGVFGGVKYLTSTPGTIAGTLIPGDPEWIPIINDGPYYSTSSSYGAVRRYGQGRIAAFAHPGATEVGLDNMAFLTNMVSWLDSKHSGRVLDYIGNGVLGAVNLRGALAGVGYTCATSTGPLSSGMLQNISVLVVRGGGLETGGFTTNEIESVRQFVQGGGGLLITGLGWVWQQYRSSQMADWPIHKLMAPYRLQWSTGFSSANVFQDFYPNVYQQIPGRTNEGPSSSALTLKFAPAITNATGYYSLRVRSEFGDVMSDPSLLRVLEGAPPTVSIIPSNLVTKVAATVALNTISTGTPPPSFQWWVKSASRPLPIKINGATNSFLILSNIQTFSSGAYTVVASNLYRAVSNTCLVVVDSARPIIAITTPGNGQRVTGSSASLIRGTARDGVGVSSVWCQCNDGKWSLAETTNTWAIWSVSLPVIPGANTVRAYAVDKAGNVSATNTVSFVYVLTGPLLVQATGPCTMSPNYSNATLELASTYTTTLSVGSGFVFSNWVGTILGDVVMIGSNPKLTFQMRSNLVLQANVIPNPFNAAKGSYNGLFLETKRLQDSSGAFSLTLSDRGSYSASLKRGPSTYSFSGQFDVAGQSSQQVKRSGSNPWVVSLWLDFASRRLWGTVSNGISGGWVAELLADAAVYDSRTNPATHFAGKYTLVIPGAEYPDGAIFLGHGYLTLGVDQGGKVTYSGSLGDGTIVGPITIPVSAEGYVPLYVPLYSGTGSLFGWLGFDDGQPATGLAGWLSWIKPAQKAVYYPAGLTNEFEAVGARYTPPTNNYTRVMEMTNGMAIFRGGNLSVPLTNSFTLTTSNRLIDLSLTNKLSMTITVSNGVFTGSVTPSGAARANTFKGVLMQDELGGYGYFLETNRSGCVWWQAIP